MSKEIKKQVLITGGSGQLSQCIKKIEKNYPDLELYFTDAKTLDITQKAQIKNLFYEREFDVIINCAAYTNVEESEKAPQKALMTNAEGVKNIAETAKEHNCILIHVSTDYVFDGQRGIPYTEEDIPNPINEYGKSKLMGEKYIQELLEKYFIIRTSWLYSEYGNNFYKTIINKSETETELTITTSEIGTPTNANDLATFVLDVLAYDDMKYGIYHYSNLGEATWYDFAKEILRFSGKLETIILKKTDNYPTFATRPKYSVLSKNKVLENIKGLKIDTWEAALLKMMN